MYLICVSLSFLLFLDSSISLPNYEIVNSLTVFINDYEFPGFQIQ